MGTTITLNTGDGHTMSAYRAAPTGTAKGGLVVIQEIFGVNEHMRGVADDFAAAGYLSLAPVLFDRVERGVELSYTPDDIARGRALRGKITWEQVMADVQAAADAVATAGKVGCVGYCWGGSVAWVAACRLPSLAAAVGYYGGAIHEFREEQPQCPVMLHFGETDGSIPLANVEAIRAAHPDVPMHIYAGAGHGFNCEERRDYNATAAARARQRTLAFFAEHLP